MGSGDSKSTLEDQDLAKIGSEIAEAAGADDVPITPNKPETPTTSTEVLSPAPNTPPQSPPTPGSAIRLSDTSQTSILNPEVYIQMKALAADFIKSNAIPSCWQTSSQVLVGLQAGVEMGMKPMEAMNSLYVVNGAVNVWGKATVRRLREHGYSIKYKEVLNSCTATVTKGKEKYVETYTFAEAEESGYTTHWNQKTNKRELNVGWKPGINRRLKLRYGVLALIIKTEIPDVLGSAVGIVEVDEDATGEPKQLISPAENKVAKALAAKNNNLEDTKAGPVKPAPKDV